MTPSEKRLAILLVAFGLLNAVLYSSLLPLWEGFDEPFHYGYVQTLSSGELPHSDTTHLSQEVRASLALAPSSAPVQANLPFVTTFPDFFQLPATEQDARVDQLHSIPVDLRNAASEIPNYESHQAPLAYLFLALPDRLLAGLPLPTRILLLRLLCSITGALLLGVATNWLGLALGLTSLWRALAVFCLFSCQMTWATIAHIANDWVAVPLAIALLAALIDCDSGRTRRIGSRTASDGWIAGILLGLGLLTKSYFLVFVPLAVVVFARNRGWLYLSPLLAAAPWYGRNLALYGNVSGMQEARETAGPVALWHAAQSIDWLDIVPYGVHQSLWTGNNSFRTFSAPTLDLMIALLAGGIVLWLLSSRYPRWITVTYAGSFIAALVYVAILTFLFLGRAKANPSPWYMQVLLAPALTTAFAGAATAFRPGRSLAAALALLFGYVLQLTYWAKLIPLYGGFEGRATFSSLGSLYVKPAMLANLDRVALLPSPVIVALAAGVLALTLALLFSLLRPLFLGPISSRD